MKSEFATFDIADYLDNEEVITEYLSAAAEATNPDVFIATLVDVLKARGISQQAARDAGLGRESLLQSP